MITRKALKFGFIYGETLSARTYIELVNDLRAVINHIQERCIAEQSDLNAHGKHLLRNGSEDVTLNSWRQRLRRL
jgi:hypothetical protein